MALPRRFVAKGTLRVGMIGSKAAGTKWRDPLSHFPTNPPVPPALTTWNPSLLRGKKSKEASRDQSDLDRVYRDLWPSHVAAGI